MRGRVEAVPLETWADLQSLPVDEWLWLDTEEPGVHLTDTLPNEPAQVTHVWGWSATQAVRVRVDVDLPHRAGGTGLAGAALTWGEGVGFDVPVAVSDNPVWPPRVGRSDMRPIPGLNDTIPSALESLTCTVTDVGPSGELVSHQVVFVRR